MIEAMSIPAHPPDLGLVRARALTYDFGTPLFFAVLATATRLFTTFLVRFGIIQIFFYDIMTLIYFFFFLDEVDATVLVADEYLHVFSGMGTSLVGHPATFKAVATRSRKALQFSFLILALS
jgi:hypothetical protein